MPRIDALFEACRKREVVAAHPRLCALLLMYKHVPKTGVVYVAESVEVGLDAALLCQLLPPLHVAEYEATAGRVGLGL